MRLGSSDPDQNVEVAIHTTGNVCSGREHTTDYEMAYCHTHRSVHEEVAATGLVDVEEDDGGEDDEEGVLDAGRDEQDISGHAAHSVLADTWQSIEECDSIRTYFAIWKT